MPLLISIESQSYIPISTKIFPNQGHPVEELSWRQEAILMDPVCKAVV